MEFDTICIIGLGYIGLPTAAVFASRGKRVIGVDVNPSVVEAVNAGRIHIVEPDLDGVVQTAVARGLLEAAVTPAPADAFVIAVPTPLDGDHQPGLDYVEAATRSIAPHLRKGNLVVLESTSPVGTTEKVEAWLASARPDLSFPTSAGDAADVRIAYCPERVLPGHVLHELVANDRIVGGLSPACSAAAVSLYRIFVAAECLVTTARTAEMCKLTENSFRDVNIAFANELSLICADLQINVWELIRLANRHPRVNILQPGPGVGGHCIAVDPWFIVSAAPDKARLIETARQVNDGKPLWVVEQVERAVSNLSLAKPRIACLGLSFKPDIDDLRESPAIEIVHALAGNPGRQILAVEPNIATLPQALSDHVELVTFETAVSSADVLVLLVDHKEFKALDRSALADKPFIDTRGIWSS